MKPRQNPEDHFQEILDLNRNKLIALGHAVKGGFSHCDSFTQLEEIEREIKSLRVGDEERRILIQCYKLMAIVKSDSNGILQVYAQLTALKYPTNDEKAELAAFKAKNKFSTSNLTLLSQPSQPRVVTKMIPKPMAKL